MDIRQITPRYSVSPQISAEDVAQLPDLGITTVICNRPNVEVPAHLQASTIGEACEAAGLDFHVLEITHQTMTPENIERQFEIVSAASGPVLAYCASGTRCTVLWALSQFGQMEAAEILGTAAKAGYISLA
jgi:uncharacterized protein (TIGR01244 family)